MIVSSETEPDVKNPRTRWRIEPLLEQPNYKIKVQVLLAKIEAAIRKPQSIPLSRQGELFIVQALIINGSDTGGSPIITTKLLWVAE